MCRDLDGNLLTDEFEVIERWKQYFDVHLNGDAAGSEDGMAIDLGARATDDRISAPGLQEVEEEIGRLKKQQSCLCGSTFQRAI
jgi:hypothetical protein